MNVLSNLLSPISIAFSVIILGYYIGRIRVLGVSLGLSGVLILAVFVGWMLSVIQPINYVLNATTFQANMKFFSLFGTALFVSVIGVTTGYSIDMRNWKDLKAMLIGSVMVASAFVIMKTILFLDKDTSFSELLGSLCGALTTTPGLSAASELKNVITEKATLGYGSSYLFGVVATVLFVQITTKKINGFCEEKIQGENNSSAALGGLIQIGVSVLFGQLIGGVKIFGFSLGNSGGILCIGIALGLIIKKYFSKKIASTKILGHFRNMGLVLFFVGNGIPAGMQLYIGFEVKTVLYGAVMTTVSIFVGALLYKLIFKHGLSATVVAGGMTSTPAIGVLMQKRCNVKLSRYSLAYVGALITIIILIRLSFNNAY